MFQELKYYNKKKFSLKLTSMIFIRKNIIKIEINYAFNN